ncbi:hypothetical protein Pla110_41050 [Polystyrenella longa]|uniref:Preprotein translocase subunit SecD n=1 Tax=Polystyrenella longa TaxID=2528007 RepID=A0A518CSZ6_9PLAN|nr:hypothetical protein [Polystyrenella longa]QDU82350.1 hypothetical protein Pla110_41050 [Polystyrenella longa]
MTRNVTIFTAVIAIISSMMISAQAASPAEQAVNQAAENNQFSYVLFYKANDAATKAMHGTLTATLSKRTDTAIIPVNAADSNEQVLIKRFDVTRLPLPAVAVLAPNGAVCSVMPRQVSSQQLLACIVSPVQATCLKTLQDNKLVALCVLPNAQASIPQGVVNFKQDKHFQDRTRVIPVLATDEQEAKFLNQLKVPTNQSTAVVAFIAPPGVMVGMFNEKVTQNEMAEKLAAAGQCCEDENCKHNKSASGSAPQRR